MVHTPYIAFADDDADDQEMLAQRVIEHYPGVHFEFFKDGQEITHYLEKCATPELPIIILLDYKMPFLTGADVLKTLCGDSRFNAIHKIVWSTSGNNEYRSKCFEFGAEKYFTKPNDIQQLDEIVSQLMDMLRISQE